MLPPDWQRLEIILATAQGLAEAERGEYLARACVGDAVLRQEAQELLEASAAAGSFLESPLARRGRGAATDPLEVSTSDPALPRQIGHYRILSLLGEGGTSTVYRASQEDGDFQRQVALKLLRIAAPEAGWLKRFRAERQFLAGLVHPNIARLLDAGTTPEGLPFLVLELVEGETIELYCEREKLPIEERLRLFMGACTAVHYAHQNLVVHRDIKPSNLLVTRDGVVKLLDFGIAKFLNPQLNPRGAPATQAWNRLLTPEYASPEQVLGRPITTATDVYSLAVVLYQLVTGQLPYPSLTGAGEGQPHPAEHGSPKRPSEVPSSNPGKPTQDRWSARQGADLDAILLKALRPEPGRRYGSAEAFADDLRRLLDGSAVQARDGSLAYRIGKTLRRHRGKAAATVAFLALLLTALAVVTLQSTTIAQQRDRALYERDRAEQVTSLLGEIFSLSDPQSAPWVTSRVDGGQVTLREVLDHGASRVHANFQQQPLLQAELLHSLGTAYQNLGLFPEAAQLLGEVVAMRRDASQEDPSRWIASLDSLALAHLHVGDYTASEALYQQSLEVEQRSVVAEVGTRIGLARLYIASGRHPQATAQARRAVELLDPTDKDHIESLCTALRMQALALRDIGRALEAEPLLRRNLALREEHFGRDHPATTLAQISLANNLWVLGRLEETKKLYPSAFERLRQQFPKQHPAYLDGLSDYGLFLQSVERFDEAETVSLEALAIARTTYEEGHLEVLVRLNNLASLASTRYRYEEASAYYSEALVTARDTLGPDHVGLAYVLSGLGMAKAETGEPELGESLIEESLEIRRRLLPPDAWLTAFTEAALGHCLTLQDRFEEAEEVLLPAYQGVVQGRGAESSEARRVSELIDELYRRWGNQRPKARQQLASKISSQ